MTEEAAALVRLVFAIGNAGSLGHVADVFRGGMGRAVKERGHDALPEHGAGKAHRWAAPDSPCMRSVLNSSGTNTTCAPLHDGVQCRSFEAVFGTPGV